MRTICLFFILLAFNVFYRAEAQVSFIEGQSAIVYALPKTELYFEIELEKVEQTPGIYYQYSERFLAEKNIITQAKISYKILNISLSSKAIPDENRTFNVPIVRNSLLNAISVNSAGLLCGVNVPHAFDNNTGETPTATRRTETKQNSAAMPLSEEYLLAGSNAKLAEGAAKQIYRLRESKLNLLSGEMENPPADGVAFRTMLTGLEDMERELTELFVGKTVTTTETKTIRFLPDEATQNKVLFRLSNFKGLVDVDDMSGSPYYINILPTKFDVVTDENQKIRRTSKKQQYLYTIEPANTNITITAGTNEMLNKTMPLPQLGAMIPFNEDLLVNSNTKVYIDHTTGRLLRIEK
jgi:hypothetical protein